MVDCAHGAASEAAALVFGRCFKKAALISDRPDRYNINDGCGVIHIDNVATSVLSEGYSLGMALDGDADRVLFVDPRGRVIDGDIILWILGRWLLSEGKLGNGVVATVMSNKALEEKLSQEGITLQRCPVGDRYVLDAMRLSGSNLGGEQSGHIIAGDFFPTGDGLGSGLLFLSACARLGEDTDTLVDRFERYPQVLKNFHTRDKDAFLGHSEVREAISKASFDLGDLGRILVRPSGTEPLVRVLVEARDDTLLEAVSGTLFERIAKVASSAAFGSLGGGEEP